jgi:hypothetical protein
MKRYERSEATNALVRYLAALEKGARVGYQELTQAAGITVTAHTTYLVSARRILERDHAQVWVCIAPKICLYRLNDAELVDRQRRWFLAGARNKLAAGARQADVIDMGHLDMSQQARLATGSIVREMAREALARSTIRRVERVARGNSNDLPAFNAVEWMISLSPKRAGS